MPLDMLFLLGFPCLPGELVLQDCIQTAPPRRLPCHSPVLPRSPSLLWIPQAHAYPSCWAVSYVGGMCAFIVNLYYQTKFFKGRDSFIFASPAAPCAVH